MLLTRAKDRWRYTLSNCAIVHCANQRSHFVRREFTELPRNCICASKVKWAIMNPVNACALFPQEQYLYIYDTLDEALMCGKTWFSVTEIAHKFKQKSQKNPITRVNEYQREYTVSLWGCSESLLEFAILFFSWSWLRTMTFDKCARFQRDQCDHDGCFRKSVKWAHGSQSVTAPEGIGPRTERRIAILPQFRVSDFLPLTRPNTKSR